METLVLLLQAAPAEPSAEKAEADPEVTEVAAPAAAETAAPSSDAAVTTSEVEEVAAPTRALEEVSGEAEEPDSKKAKVRT